MIRKLHLKDFKCFSEQKILFAPITLLTGLNSSGKSTTLQALRICKEQQILDGLGNAKDLRCASSSNYPKIIVEFTDGSSAKCIFSDSGITENTFSEDLNQVYYISADRLGPRVRLPFKNNVSHVGEVGENVYALLSQYRSQGGVPALLRHASLPDVSSVFEQVRAGWGLLLLVSALTFRYTPVPISALDRLLNPGQQMSDLASPTHYLFL